MPRCETKASMARRAENWDYRQPGTYMVTLTLADRTRPWLGEVVGTDVEARLEPSPLGRCVQAQWQALAEVWPGVEPRELQLMPEHLHGILRVRTPQKHPLGQIIGSFKARTTAMARTLASELASTPGGAASGGHHAAPCTPLPPAPPATLLPASLSATLSAAGPGAGHSPAGGEGGGWCPPTAAPPGVPASLLAGGSLWSPGFHDAILWTRARYRTERAYLLDNPRRLALKRAHPALFRVVHQLAVPLSTGETAHFMALGNRFLLQRPLVQVQVSRRDFIYRRDGVGHIRRRADGSRVAVFASSLFAEQRAAWLQAARAGAVLLSPCVSDGERQIAYEALQAGYSLITLHNCGFSELNKPAGRAFEACCAGRLLMLAPAAWPYQPAAKAMTRQDAVVLNRLAQWLVGEGAAAVNYHGQQPREIDSLARAAALVRQEEGV